MSQLGLIIVSLIASIVFIIALYSFSLSVMVVGISTLTFLFGWIVHAIFYKTKSNEKINLVNVSSKLPIIPAEISNYDNVTDLPSYNFFTEILTKAINHARRRNQILAILLIDIQNIENIYSKHGQAIVDEIIKRISKRFSQSLRAEDIIARADNNEFIVLLNDITKPKFAGTVAEKILKTCAEPINIETRSFNLITHIGVSLFPTDGNTLDELINNVNQALTNAKQHKYSNYQFFSKTIDAEARHYIQLETALRAAINNKELNVYYQPQLHIKRGVITGVEALLRWKHPRFGDISPAVFIAIAEDSGYIMHLSEWALREACKTNKHWQDEGYEHVSIAVNLSAKQFRHPEIGSMVYRVLSETGLNPNYLEIEIDETTVMADVDIARERLMSLKSLGIRIAIDHFGTGYTSISHLKQFPISVIKIDRSYIKGIPYSPDDLAITSAFIALAHNLGLETIAEGVETAEQVQYLANQECDVVQGFYLSHPVPADKLMEQLTKLSDKVLF